MLIKNKILAVMTAMFFVAGVLSPARAYAQDAESGSQGQVALEAQVTGCPAIIEDGRAEVTLPDGKVVIIEGEDLPEGGLIVIDPVTEADEGLKEWLDQPEQEGKDPWIAFDGDLVDENGERSDIPGQITVIVKPSDDYTDPDIFHVSDGNGEAMDTTKEDGTLSFVTTDGDGCFVLIGKGETPSETEETQDSSGQETESNGSETGSSDSESDSNGGANGSGTNGGTDNQNGTGTSGGSGDSVKTGDHAPVGLFAATCLGAGVVALGCSIYMRRSVRENKKN